MEFLLVSAQILLSNYFANAEIFRPLGEKLMPLHQTSIEKTFLFSGPRKYPDGQLIKLGFPVFSSPLKNCWLTSYCGKIGSRLEL